MYRANKISKQSTVTFFFEIYSKAGETMAQFQKSDHQIIRDYITANDHVRFI